MADKKNDITLRERFWSKVDIQGPDDCWEWKASRTGEGYGRFTLEGRKVRAHRVAFFFDTGDWPEPHGLHSCDNPPCCNPGHIRSGTDKDNEDDVWERNRHPKKRLGENDPRASMTSAMIRNIYRIRGTEPAAKTARRYGLTGAQVAGIQAGRTWRRVTGASAPCSTEENS